MERLTAKERNFDGSAYTNEPFITEDSSLTPYGEKILNKLADYEDAEEQGLLLRLPCKVGDKIYNPVFEYYKSGELIKEPYVIEAVVARFGFAKEELTIVLRNGIEYREFYADSIGKTVFLTREEAEKALADMGV